MDLRSSASSSCLTIESMCHSLCLEVSLMNQTSWRQDTLLPRVRRSKVVWGRKRGSVRIVSVSAEPHAVQWRKLLGTESSGGDSVLALRVKKAWSTIRWSLITIYNDVYDEHLFVFAAGLSYYFVLSLFPLLVSMASLLGYVPIPHLFEGLLCLMAKLVPGDGMSLLRNILSDVINKHIHFLTLGLVFTIWTASSGFAAIIDGLDLVYRVREPRPVWTTRPLAMV